MKTRITLVLPDYTSVPSIIWRVSVVRESWFWRSIRQMWLAFLLIIFNKKGEHVVTRWLVKSQLMKTETIFFRNKLLTRDGPVSTIPLKLFSGKCQTTNWIRWRNTSAWPILVNIFWVICFSITHIRIFARLYDVFLIKRPWRQLSTMEDSTSFLKTWRSSPSLLIHALGKRPTLYPSSSAFFGSQRISVSPSLNHEKTGAWFRVRKNEDTGRWVKSGRGGILFGHRETYYDPTF